MEDDNTKYIKGLKERSDTFKQSKARFQEIEKLKLVKNQNIIKDLEK